MSTKKVVSLNRRIIFCFIENYIKQNGYPPTVREISEDVKLSPGTTHGYLKRLKQEGCIDFKEGCPRTIQIKV